MARIGILGAGSWGTSVAVLLANNGHEVHLWDRDRALVAQVTSKRTNEKYLSGIQIPDNLQLVNDLGAATLNQECVFFAVPSHAIREVIDGIDDIGNDTLIVSLAKGIENDTLMRPSEIIAQRIDADRIAVISGPSHAEEVSRGVPTVVVCASSNRDTARWIQSAIMSSTFRVYAHGDVIGVEIAGALKNIIALAAGIIDGVGGGDNTKAALITRALAEITRLGTKLGANSLTFAGLSGMGDMIVTCMSKYSRNRFLGEQIGRGKSLQQALEEMVMVAEGVKTTKSAYSLARKHEVDTPIINEAYNVLFENKEPEQAVFDLMTRAAKFEDWG